eukprot:5371425-Amphidinium_carterae.1
MTLAFKVDELMLQNRRSHTNRLVKTFSSCTSQLQPAMLSKFGPRHETSLPLAIKFQQWWAP